MVLTPSLLLFPGLQTKTNWCFWARTKVLLENCDLWGQNVGQTKKLLLCLLLGSELEKDCNNAPAVCSKPEKKMKMSWRISLLFILVFCYSRSAESGRRSFLVNLMIVQAHQQHYFREWQSLRPSFAYCSFFSTLHCSLGKQFRAKSRLSIHHV